MPIEASVEIDGQTYFAPIPVVEGIDRLRSALDKIAHHLPKGQFYAAEIARAAISKATSEPHVPASEPMSDVCMHISDGLMPCPFCGGEARCVDIPEGDNQGGSCIECATCGACSPVHFDRKENLEDSWNFRVAPPRALVELCLRLIESIPVVPGNFPDDLLLARAQLREFLK